MQYKNMREYSHEEFVELVERMSEEELLDFSAKYDNIVVTEACFGGKYIGLPTNGSMLLSSMSNSTMLYLGSSVTAYGTIDKRYYC